MTAHPTLPIPLRTGLSRVHEHAWLAESRHPTSAGVVFYVRCVDCGARRVDLQPHSDLPPSALTRTLEARDGD